MFFFFHLRRQSLVLANVAAFAVLTWTSWYRFGHLLIDFPREIYHAWRVAEGARPFADFEHPHGAFALLWDGWWFRLLGAHSDTLRAINTVLAAGIAGALYALVRYAWESRTALLTLLVVQVVFLFGTFRGTTIFNYIAPYNQSSLHSMALAVLGLFSLVRFQHSKRLLWLIVAGAATGLSHFTRVDAAMALTATSLWGLLLLCAQPIAWGRRLQLIGAFSLGFSLPVALFSAYFLIFLPLDLFWRAILGPWAVISQKTATTTRQLWATGLDDPLGNVLRLLGWAAVIVGMALGVRAWATLAERAHMTEQQRKLLLGLTFSVPLLPVLASWEGTTRFWWLHLPTTLPLWLALLTLILAVKVYRQVRQGPVAPQLFAQSLLSTFGLLMLARMPLNARVYEYGFHQALVATTVVLAWIIHHYVVPCARSARQRFTKAVVAGAYCSCLACAVINTATTFAEPAEFVDLPGFRVAAQRMEGLEEVLAGLRLTEQLTSGGATFAAVPEGTLYHFVLRKPHPTIFDHLATVEVSAFGEDRIVEAFDQARPDYIILIHKHTVYAPLFGATPDFGQKLFEWIQLHYEPFALLGQKPFTAINSEGVEFYRRRNNFAGAQKKP